MREMRVRQRVGIESEGEVCRKMNKKGRLREMKLLLRIFF